MLEVMNKVTQAEKTAEDTINASVQEALRLKADAHKKGKAELEAAREEAYTEASRLVAHAKRDTTAGLETAKVQATKECEVLSEKAAARLDSAANRIVERIVGSL